VLLPKSRRVGLAPRLSFEAWGNPHPTQLHAGLTGSGSLTQKMKEGRRQLADYEQRVRLQETVIEPYRPHWLTFTNQLGNFITSSVPGTGAFTDFATTPDFGDPNDRLEWFDEDLAPKWDEWQTRNGGNIDWTKLYNGGYANT
jgi:hypothetical protein